MRNKFEFTEEYLENQLKDLYKPNDNIKSEVRFNMKKKNNFYKKIVAIAAIAIICIPFTTFGKEMFTIIKEAVLPSGRISVIEEKENVDPEGMVERIAKEDVGKVFDKDGNVLKEIKYGQKIYNKKGEEIVSTSYDESTGETSYYSEKDMEDETIVFDNLEEYTKTLSFNPLLLGDNYKFDRAEGYLDENKAYGNSDYGTFFYKDSKGKSIIIFERLSSEEAAYTRGGEDVKEINIGGVDLIYSKESLDFEKDGLLVGIIYKNGSYDELIDVYKNLKAYNK